MKSNFKRTMAAMAASAMCAFASTNVISASAATKIAASKTSVTASSASKTGSKISVKTNGTLTTTTAAKAKVKTTTTTTAAKIVTTTKVTSVDLGSGITLNDSKVNGLNTGALESKLDSKIEHEIAKDNISIKVSGKELAISLGQETILESHFNENIGLDGIFSVDDIANNGKADAIGRLGLGGKLTVNDVLGGLLSGGRAGMESVLGIGCRGDESDFDSVRGLAERICGYDYDTAPDFTPYTEEEMKNLEYISQDFSKAPEITGCTDLDKTFFSELAVCVRKGNKAYFIINDDTMCIQTKLSEDGESSILKCSLPDGWSRVATTEGAFFWKSEDGDIIINQCGNSCDITKGEHPDLDGSCNSCTHIKEKKSDENNETKEDGSNKSDDNGNSNTNNDSNNNDNNNNTDSNNNNGSNDDNDDSTGSNNGGSTDNDDDTTATNDDSNKEEMGGCPTDPIFQDECCSSDGEKTEMSDEEKNELNYSLGKYNSNYGKDGGISEGRGSNDGVHPDCGNPWITNWGNEPKINKTLTAEEEAHLLEVATNVNVNHGDPKMR